MDKHNTNNLNKMNKKKMRSILHLFANKAQRESKLRYMFSKVLFEKTFVIRT